MEYRERKGRRLVLHDHMHTPIMMGSDVAPLTTATNDGAGIRYVAQPANNDGV